MKSILRVALLILIFLCFVTITSLYLVFDSRGTATRAGSVEILIPEGASLSSIANHLYQDGVIQSPLTFKIAAGLLQKSRAIYPGTYTVATNLTNTEALASLAHAKAVEIAITIPEGLRSDEIIGMICNRLKLDSLVMSDLLTDSSLLSLTGGAFSHLEGTLFPDTYRFLERTDEYSVLYKLVNHFRKNITSEILDQATALGFDLVDLITFASLIEKETGRDDERNLVASVYHNRLKEDMLLGCDPTLIYMLVRRGEWNGNIQRKHFSIRDPYNTYRYRGLPPGPIANPGLASIKASLNPADSDFRYFVGKNDGTGAHDFSKTLREHTNKVNRYQRWKRSS